MTTQTSAPRTAQEALQQARLHERAQAILTAGYRFCEDKQTNTIAVVKPGRLAASYWIVDDECDCPIGMRGEYCKHRYAWKLLQDEEADELAGLEEQCRLYDMEEGRHLDAIPLPKLTRDVVALMEHDLRHVQADIDAQGKRHTGYIHAHYQHQRAGQLENALQMVNAYRILPE